MEEKRILVKLDNQGRVFVPSQIRKALGIKVGDVLVLKVKDRKVEVSTLEHTIEKAKEIVKEYARGRKLWKELIEERREEAKDE